MTPADIMGGLILGAPAFLLAYVGLWYRQRPVFWFCLALIVVGLGYLHTTGALAEVGGYVLDDAPAPSAR